MTQHQPSVGVAQLLVGLYDVFTKTPNADPVSVGVALVTVEEFSGLRTEHYGIKRNAPMPEGERDQLIIQLRRSINPAEPSQVEAGWRDFMGFIAENEDGRWLSTPVFDRPADLTSSTAPPRRS
jgi:hypothetical protein